MLRKYLLRPLRGRRTDVTLPLPPVSTRASPVQRIHVMSLDGICDNLVQLGHERILCLGKDAVQTSNSVVDFFTPTEAVVKHGVKPHGFKGISKDKKSFKLLREKHVRRVCHEVFTGDIEKEFGQVLTENFTTKTLADWIHESMGLFTSSSANEGDYWYSTMKPQEGRYEKMDIPEKYKKAFDDGDQANEDRVGKFIEQNDGQSVRELEFTCKDAIDFHENEARIPHGNFYTTRSELLWMYLSRPGIQRTTLPVLIKYAQLFGWKSSHKYSAVLVNATGMNECEFSLFVQNQPSTADVYYITQ